jgi:hypothetical protein
MSSQARTKIQKRAKTVTKCSMQVQGADGKLTPLLLTPIQTGTRTNIMLIVEYSDGTQAPALNVTWTIPSNVVFIFDFNPTTTAGVPVPPVPGVQNPISLVPWFVPGPFVPNATTTAAIIAAGLDPLYGQPVEATDDLPVVTPNITWTGSPSAGTGVEIMADSTGQTLCYSESDATAIIFDLVINGVPAGQQIIMVQLVSTNRFYSFEGRGTSSVANSNGQYWCDYPPSATTFYLEAAESTGGSIDLEFFDRPEQPLPLQINNQEVSACTVSDNFQVFYLYRSSNLPVDQYDPNNLWSPVMFTAIWGWQATAVEDGGGDFELSESEYVPLVLGPLIPPSWVGSIPDNVLQPQRYLNLP